MLVMKVWWEKRWPNFSGNGCNILEWLTLLIAAERVVLIVLFMQLCSLLKIACRVD